MLNIRLMVFENNEPIRGLFAAKAAFMHQAMVIAAELHQVVDTGLTACGPVFDVVAIDVILMGAAGKAAAFVPGF